MLYELSAIVDTPDGHSYQSRVVEAPAPRRGVVPKALLKWHHETFLTNWPGGSVLAHSIAGYCPVRIGYAGANGYGVSGGGTTFTLVQHDPDRLL